nr:Gag-Pol polyprotein [Tanacetum cinerariifolium]
YLQTQLLIAQKEEAGIQIQAEEFDLMADTADLDEIEEVNVNLLHQDQPSFNQNYMQQPIPNPKDITDLTTAMNMPLALMAKAFKLNYSTPTNNSQRISSNPRNRQIAQPGNLNGYNDVQNVENQVIHNAVQNPRIQNGGNQNGLILVPGNANENPNGNGNIV